jgi:hypothetical protein
MLGTANAAIGALGFVAFATLTVVSGMIIGAGHDVAWGIVAGVISLAAAAAMALLAASGVSTWRSVRVDSTGGFLSLPGFTARRGFSREILPIAEVTDARLAYRSKPRNGRWQLVVSRRNGPPVACDSITSYRSPHRDVRDTRAWRAAHDIHTTIATANRSNVNP